VLPGAWREWEALARRVVKRHVRGQPSLARSPAPSGVPAQTTSADVVVVVVVERRIGRRTSEFTLLCLITHHNASHRITSLSVVWFSRPTE